MTCSWDQLVTIQNLNGHVWGKNINNSSKQPGCDVNTQHGCYGGVRISHRSYFASWRSYFASLHPVRTGENPSVLTAADACGLKPLILKVQYWNGTCAFGPGPFIQKYIFKYCSCQPKKIFAGKQSFHCKHGGIRYGVVENQWVRREKLRLRHKCYVRSWAKQTQNLLTDAASVWFSKVQRSLFVVVSHIVQDLIENMSYLPM